MPPPPPRRRRPQPRRRVLPPPASELGALALLAAALQDILDDRLHSGVGVVRPTIVEWASRARAPSRQSNCPSRPRSFASSRLNFFTFGLAFLS
jgi:hypothetical protein